MKRKSIFICETCFSRNYSFYLNSDREKTIFLNKYCSKCQKTSLHSENR